MFAKTSLPRLPVVGGFFVERNKMSKLRTNRRLKKDLYPKYKIKSFFQGRKPHSYTTNQKSRLWRWLLREKNVEKACFAVVYAPDMKNESILYKFPQQREQFHKDLKTFTSKQETDWMMANL